MSPGSLSQALRATTQAAHERAENSRFVTQLMAGRACPGAFTALAVQQLVIYQALEDVLHEHYADHPILAGIDDRRLDRVASLRHDLRLLVGPDVEVRLVDGRLPIVPAATAYARELRERHTAEMMLAHHYVRYLGDLSGGQIIARLVQRHYDIPADALTLYRFAGIERPKLYKDEYRAALDALRLTPAQRDRVLAQAVRSFELNEAVFADLDAAQRPQHAAAGIG